MKKELKFTEINLCSWCRGEMFYYFSKMAPTGYSITTELDVTHMRKVLKEKGKKFFPTYLWLVTKTLMEQDEFMIAEVDGKVGKFNRLTPLYASFHDDNKTFSLMWCEYDDEFLAFYDEYIKNQELYGNNHGVLCQKGSTPPPDAYTVSCIPWVSFKHFAVHSYDSKPYYFPSVEAGKFEERGERTYMPISLTCHHAATDGYHVDVFLRSLQEYMDKIEEFIYRQD